jgi:hypothetical protein
MHRPVFRVPRLGFALVFLPVFLGSASGAPAPGIAAPAGPPPLKHSATSAQFPADRPAFVPATIPCVSGSCQVQVYARAHAASRKPLPRTTSDPQALAQR